MSSVCSVLSAFAGFHFGLYVADFGCEVSLGSFEAGLALVEDLELSSVSFCYSVDSCGVRVLDSFYSSCYCASGFFGFFVELFSGVFDLFSDCSDFLSGCLVEGFHAGVYVS